MSEPVLEEGSKQRIRRITREEDLSEVRLQSVHRCMRRIKRSGFRFQLLTATSYLEEQYAKVTLSHEHLRCREHYLTYKTYKGDSIRERSSDVKKVVLYEFEINTCDGFAIIVLNFVVAVHWPLIDAT